MQVTKMPTKDKKAEGKIIEILGNIDQAGIDMMSLVREYDLPYEFPDPVLIEAKGIKQEIDAKKIKNRLDYKITYLENLNKNTDKTNNILRTSIHQKDEEISLLQNKIKNLNSLLIEKDNSIEKYQKDIDDLQKEVEIQKGKTEYTKTILNQQMDTLEDDIKNEIMSRVKIELESIYDISTILDEKNAQRIQRRLKQINKVFNK